MGNIGLAQNLITLVKTAEKLNDFDFELVGNGIEFDLLSEHINAKGLKNVTLRPAVDWEMNPGIYAASDILYAQVTSAYKSAIPSKIYEYIAAGKKVVLGLPDGVAKETFLQFSGVWVHEPSNIEDCMKVLSEAIKKREPNIDANMYLLRKDYIRENYESRLTNLI